jgi:hypothetical protein
MFTRALRLFGFVGACGLALLSDVLIEQGKLLKGVVMLQRMVDTKPGTEAFARIAHVRWLKGDPAGAMAAMESALQASEPRGAGTRAWPLTLLSGFSLQRGDAARRRPIDFP